MDVSHDGSRLASGVGVPEAPGETDRVFMWETATGRSMGLPFGEKVGSVLDFTFSADGRYVLYVQTDGRPRLWNIEKGEKSELSINFFKASYH